MNYHELYLQRVLRGTEANFYVGSGFAKFSVNNGQLVATTMFGEEMSAALNDQAGISSMFADLEVKRMSIGFKDGMIYGQSSNVFSNIPGVQQMSRGLVNFRTKGIQRNQQLHNLSKRGYTVTEAIIDPSATEGLESLEKLVFGGRQTGRIEVDKLADEIKGALVPTGSGGVRVIQITQNGAQGPMSFRDTMNLLGLDPFSVKVDGRLQNPTDILGKLGKRLRGHFQSKGISIETGKNTKLKAAVFNPESLFGDEYESVLSRVAGDLGFDTTKSLASEQRRQADDVIKQIFDGQIINVNPEKLQRLARQNTEQYIRDIKLQGQDLAIANQAARDQERLFRDGGVGNARIENAVLVDMNGNTLAPDSQLGGRQIKGNMNFTVLSNYELDLIIDSHDTSVHQRVMAMAIRRARERDIDFLAPSTGVVGELGGAYNDADGTLVSVAAQREGEIARVNRQTLRAQPEFYSTNQIIDYAKNNVNLALDELSNGNINEDVLDYLRNQANMRVEDAYDYGDLSRSQITARQRAFNEAADIIRFVEADPSGQALLRDPAMRSRIQSAIKDLYYGTDANNPKFIIPNAMAGHISSDAPVSGQSIEYVNERHGQVRQGYMVYDPETKQFVFPSSNEARFSHYMKILGGADLDDTINAALFFNDNPGPNGSRVVAAIFRNPTARGEGLLMDMELDDAFVSKKLKELSTFYANARGNPGDREARDYFDNYEDHMARKRELQRQIRADERTVSRLGDESGNFARSIADKRMEIEQIDNEFNRHAQVTLRNAKDAVNVTTLDRADNVVRYHNDQRVLSYNMITELEDSSQANRFFNSTTDALRNILRMPASDDASRLYLGQAINFSDFMESLLDEGQDFSRVMQRHGFIPDKIGLYGREALIDYYQKFGGSGTEVEATLNTAMEAVADSLAKAYKADEIGKEAGVLLPFSSLYDLDKNLTVPSRFVDIANARLAQVGVTLQELVGELDDDTTEFGRYMIASRDGMSLADSQIEKMEAIFEKQNLNTYVSAANQEDYEKAARSVINEYNAQRKTYNINGDNIVSGLDLEVNKRIVSDNVLQRALQEAQGLADNLDARSGDVLDEILMNVRSLAGEGELRGMLNDLASDRSPRASISSMLRNVAARRLLLDQRVNVLDLVSMEGVEEVSIGGSRLSDDEIASRLRELDAQRLTDDEIRRGIPGVDRFKERSFVDGIAARIPEFKNIKEGIKALWQRDVFRKGFYGVAAVASASAIYQGSKDRTPEQVQGPEFLPGGSAYEGYMQPGVDYPSFEGFRPGAGTSYSIQANGNYDPAMVAAAAESITGVSATGMTYYRQPVFANPNRAIANGF